MRHGLMLAGLMATATLWPTAVFAVGTTQVTSLGATVDGTALGDVDGDGRLEMALLTRPGNTASSGISLWDGKGKVLWNQFSKVELAGSPLMADFDGDGLDEVAYCELAEAGYCKVLGATGQLKSQVGPFYFPGMTMAGPSAVDVTGDGVPELIVASFGGVVAAYQGATQGKSKQLWSTSLWDLYGEQIFGHPAIGDIDGDGTPEIVVAGYNWGTTFALEAKTGKVKWASEDATGEAYAYANGALLTDLDSDGVRDVVIALASADGVDTVSLLDGKTGKNRSQIKLAGSILSFSTPVAADVDGNGKRETFLQGGDGILRELVWRNGALAVGRSLNLGAESWSPPTFVDTNQDGILEIVAASLDKLSFLDGKTLATKDTYTSKLGGLMPTSVVGDLDRNGTVDLYFGAWNAQTLERIEFKSQSAQTWRALGGGPQRSGEQAPTTTLSTSSAWDAARDKLVGLINSGVLTTTNAQIVKTRILPLLDNVEVRVLRGDIDRALGRLQTAISRLETELVRYDSTQLRRELAEQAIVTAQMYRDRVAAFAGTKILSKADANLKKAKDSLAKGDAKAAAASATAAAGDVEDAAEDVTTFVHGTCAQALGTTDPVLKWECQLLGVHQTLVGKAGAQLEDAIVDLADLDLDSSLVDLEDTVQELAKQAGTTATQLAVATPAERLTRLYLDDVTLAGAQTAQNLTKAETSYTLGKSELGKAKYTTALAALAQAADSASP
jgi:hypothetical protein